MADGGANWASATSAPDSANDSDRSGPVADGTTLVQVHAYTDGTPEAATNSPSPPPPHNLPLSLLPPEPQPLKKKKNAAYSRTFDGVKDVVCDEQKQC